MLRDQTELITNEAIHTKRYSVYFCNLVTQHANRVCRLVFSPVDSLSLPYFFTLSRKRQDFPENKLIEHKICVFRFLYDIQVKYFSSQEKFNAALP